MLSFERLEVWKKSIMFSKTLVEIANRLPTKYQFSFADQLRRAALSIPSNIAEGAGRRSRRDSSNFYSISRGSVYESVNIIKLLVELDEPAIKDVNLDRLFNDAEEIVKMIYGLSKS